MASLRSSLATLTGRTSSSPAARFSRLGEPEAFVRARITYFHQVGYYAMRISESRRQRLALLLGTGTGALALSGQAMAQSTESPGANSNEVVVTARFKAEKLQNVGESVQVLSQRAFGALVRRTQ
jgi:hypothetical protein